MNTNEKALQMHEQWNGKLETIAKSKVNTREDLAIAYTPGVAEPCKVIAEDKEKAYTYTWKSNTVAVVSDGSAVLGLGNIGPYAAMPVMEGKCVLFKEFGDVNAVPICLDTQDTEEWNDDNWNNFKLKDTAKETVGEIVKTGFREIAADVYMKASEEGIGAVISDKEFIIDTVIDVAGNGVKTAVSAGLVVAEESGIIPPTTFGALATIAHKAVEEAKVFKEVIKGKTTIIQALSKIKNTVVSTAAAVWEQNKKVIKEEVVESVGYIFGVKGAAIAGAINGLLTKTEDEPKLKSVLKSVANSVKGFMTKKIHLPFFNKNKNKQLEMN